MDHLEKEQGAATRKGWKARECKRSTVLFPGDPVLFCNEIDLPQCSRFHSAPDVPIRTTVQQSPLTTSAILS